MGNVFKLTKAEFRKIFKRPSVFIMALLLVVSILISFYIFSPDNRPNDLNNYNDINSSQEFFTLFDSGTTSESKINIDKSFVKTDGIITFYKLYNERNNTLTSYYNDIITSFNKMDNESNSTIKNQYLNDFKTKVNNFKLAYSSFDTLSEFDTIINPIINTPDYKNTNYQNYYLVTSCPTINSLTNMIVHTPAYTAEEICEMFKVDNFEQKLNQELFNANNFIYTNIKGYIDNFNKQYQDLTLNLLQGWSSEPQMKIKNARVDMHTSLVELKNYITSVVDNPYPIVIINKSVYEELTAYLDEAISRLTFSVSQTSSRDEYVSAKEDIERSNIVRYLNQITPSDNTKAKISQITIPDSIIEEFESIKEKVITNKSDLIDKINALKEDESVQNIKVEVTNYYQLSIAYNEIVTDKILLNITDNYDKATYTKFYNYNFATLNKFEKKENITVNKYYIDNNTYSNVYLNNFSFNETSSAEGNAYDFMFFSLELCTIIITVFAMMLICNIITAETESGTIKLLLVRPFSRSKIITAKLFATIFFAVIFMLFCGILTFIGGMFKFGLTSTPVLVTFNAVSTFTISPIGLILIDILTLLLDIIFFILLALMTSIICKNYAGAITVSLVVIIANYALNIIFAGTFWYSLLPGMNLHLFKYFGNAFSMGTPSQSIVGLLASLFFTGIESSMNFTYSIILYLAYTTIFTIISYVAFQKRDF